MKIIVITQEKFFPEEAAAINEMFASGLERLHLRKPGSSAAECAALLRSIGPEYHGRIVLHDHYELACNFGIGGIHVNSRNGCRSCLEGVHGLAQIGSISRSCHSIDEILRLRGDYSYLFLSPVFDSISKSGYRGAFDTGELRKLGREGVIDSRIIALGGITGERIPFVRELGFGGAALLGCIWNSPSPPEAFRDILCRVEDKDWRHSTARPHKTISF